MYSFTDREIAQELVQECRHGVSVEIYRDRRQYEQEEARGPGVSEILRECSTIHVRVKGNNELMHLKAYEVDDTILRDGSANWSISAVRYQDNQISIVSDPAQIEQFRQVFAGMWERSDNRVIQ